MTTLTEKKVRRIVREEMRKYQHYQDKRWEGLNSDLNIVIICFGLGMLGLALGVLFG